MFDFFWFFFQKIYFDIARSDYMIDQVKTEYDSRKSLNEERPYEIKQIEMNMIAASFSGLSSITPSLHRYFIEDSFPIKT